MFYTFMQRFSLFFFGAISYMVLVRALSKGDNKDEIAAWSLYLVIMTLFETVKQGLLRNPTIKFLGLPEYVNNKNEIQFASLVINVIFSAISILVLLVLGTAIAGWLKSPQLLSLLRWSIVMILLLIPFSHCEVMLQANYRFSAIFWAYFVRQGLIFLAIVVINFFLPAYFTLTTMMLVQISALGVGMVIMMINAKPFLMRRFHLHKRIIGQMLHFGKYIFGTNLFSNLARSFDHFVTANVLDPVQGKNYVSYYNVTARIYNMMDVPSLAAADVLFPKNVETLETDGIGKVKYHFEKMIATILALIVPASLFVFLFPKFIIYVLAGPKYYDAIPILQITVLFSITRPLGYLFGSTLDSIGKPKINFWVGLLYMLISLGVNYICLYSFQGIGAAYATVINYCIGLWLMTYILKKYIHLELKNIYVYAIQFYRDIFKLLKKFRKSPSAS